MLENTGTQPVGPLETIQRQELPKLYINGFLAGTSLSDVFVLAQTAGSPVAVLLMSFTTAKTLVRQLGDLLSDLEKTTGQEVLAMEDIHEASLRAAQERPK